MTLINCPECSIQISDKAISCSNCGYAPRPLLEEWTLTRTPLTRKRRTSSNFLLLIVISMLINSCSPNLYTSMYLPEQPFDESLPINVNNKPLRINIYQLIGPNSAGGFDINMWCINNSNKIIKYTYITFSFKNGVGDPAVCEIRKTSSFTGKATGPAKYGEYIVNGEWKNVIYDYSTKYAIISNIKIEYMDGSVLEMAENSTKLLMSK